MARRFDVVLHVADENRLGRSQFILREDVMNFLPLVPHAEVRQVEKLAQARLLELHCEVGLGNSAQQERPQPPLPAEDEELPRVRQRYHGCLGVLEMAVKPFLELIQRYVRHIAVIKLLVGQAELGAKPVERHLGNAGSAEDMIVCLPDGGQIIHEGS